MSNKIPVNCVANTAISMRPSSKPLISQLGRSLYLEDLTTRDSYNSKNNSKSNQLQLKIKERFDTEKPRIKTLSFYRYNFEIKKITISRQSVNEVYLGKI